MAKEKEAAESKKSIKPSLSINKVKSIGQKPIIKEISYDALLAVYCYAVIFVIGGFLVSGGHAANSVYFIITICIFLIASQILFIRNKFYSSFRITLIAVITSLLAFAILDYLLINLWLMKNNLEYYKYWPNYFTYLVVVALPFIRSNWSRIAAPSLKSLLTKKA